MKQSKVWKLAIDLERWLWEELRLSFWGEMGFKLQCRWAQHRMERETLDTVKKWKFISRALVKSKENKYSSSSSGNWFFRYLAMNFNLYFKVSCKDFTNHGTKNVKNNLTCITLIVNNMCQFDCAKDCPARL